MQAPSMPPSQRSNKSITWIVLSVFGMIAVCCAGGVILGVTLFRSGMKSAEADLPYATAVLSRLSASDYRLEKVKDDFVPELTQGVKGQQFQVALDAFRTSLGKFVKAEKVTGFNVKSVNGVSTRSVIFEAEFEKSNGVVTFTSTGSEAERRVAGLYINSKALNN